MVFDSFLFIFGSFFVFILYVCFICHKVYFHCLKIMMVDFFMLSNMLLLRG